jgi:hypothetical protein
MSSGVYELTMRVAFVVVVLLIVAGCATRTVDDVARRAPISERSDLAPEAGGGGGGGM